MADANAGIGALSAPVTCGDALARVLHAGRHPKPAAFASTLGSGTRQCPRLCSLRPLPRADVPAVRPTPPAAQNRRRADAVTRCADFWTERRVAATVLGQVHCEAHPAAQAISDARRIAHTLTIPDSQATLPAKRPPRSHARHASRLWSSRPHVRHSTHAPHAQPGSGSGFGPGCGVGVRVWWAEFVFLCG